MCQNWGYKRLAEYNRKESVEEMKHAEDLMDRILFLDGTPNMADLFPIRIGQDVRQQFENDMALEMDAIPRLNEAIALAREVGDNASRALFEKILVDEEEHVDYIEAQMHIINEIGLGNYLAQHIHEGDSD
jgi:bacterioferritin